MHTFSDSIHDLLSAYEKSMKEVFLKVSIISCFAPSVVALGISIGGQSFKFSYD